MWHFPQVFYGGGVNRKIIKQHVRALFYSIPEMYCNIFRINRTLNQTLKKPNTIIKSWELVKIFLFLHFSSIESHFLHFWWKQLSNPVEHLSSLCILKDPRVKGCLQHYNVVQIEGSGAFHCLHSYTPNLLQ